MSFRASLALLSTALLLGITSGCEKATPSSQVDIPDALLVPDSGDQGRPVAPIVNPGAGSRVVPEGVPAWVMQPGVGDARLDLYFSPARPSGETIMRILSLMSRPSPRLSGRIFVVKDTTEIYPASAIGHCLLTRGAPVMALAELGVTEFKFRANAKERECWQNSAGSAAAVSLNGARLSGLSGSPPLLAAYIGPDTSVAALMMGAGSFAAQDTIVISRLEALLSAHLGSSPAGGRAIQPLPDR